MFDGRLLMVAILLPTIFARQLHAHTNFYYPPHLTNKAIGFLMVFGIIAYVNVC